MNEQIQPDLKTITINGKTYDIKADLNNIDNKTILLVGGLQKRLKNEMDFDLMYDIITALMSLVKILVGNEVFENEVKEIIENMTPLESMQLLIDIQAKNEAAKLSTN